MAESIPSPLFAALQRIGAMSLPHSGRTLFAHLHGTYRQLKAWEQPDMVCLAGLFHSIYGTNAFAVPISMHRAELQSLIGLPAEELVWLFASVDRPTAILQGLTKTAGQTISLNTRSDRSRTLSATLTASAAQVKALAEIECANLVEQSHWGHALRSFFCLGTDCAGLLSASTMASLRRGWTLQLQAKEGS